MKVPREFFAVAMLSVLAACAVQPAPQATAPQRQEPAVAFEPDELRAILRLSPLGPPPASTSNAWADDPAAARLGQALFYDMRFSADGQVGCVTCHLPEHAFTDNLALARGVGDVDRHAPTVLNAAHQRWYFWDGRADSLWSQACQPFEAANEHGFSRLALVRGIIDDEEYHEAYERLFGPLPELSAAARALEHARPAPYEPGHPHQDAWDTLQPEEQTAITGAFVHVAKAIAAYERLLVGGTSAFDRFVSGLRTGNRADLDALSESAQRGLKFFVGKGNCVLCHASPLLSDREFHSIRIRPGEPRLARDPGRRTGIRKLLLDPFRGSGPFSDDPQGVPAAKLAHLRAQHGTYGEFKTPSLRNVALTAPYMHQGQMADLDAVLEHYSEMQDLFDPKPDHIEMTLRPLHLSPAQREDLMAFLAALSDAPVSPELAGPPAAMTAPVR